MRPETLERDADILLAMWREACQHIEIGECVARVAPLLVDRMPFDRVIVRRFDLERPSIDTAAAATANARIAPLEAPLRTDLTREELELLVAWVRHGHVLHEAAGDLREKLPSLLPEGITGDVLAGPLRALDGVTGVLIFVAQSPPRSFGQDHARLTASLLDPLSAALANDWRVHEMEVEREAVEADRQALLSRLGRREMAETIIGANAGLRSALDRVERVAGLDVPVLILGETGSGKEVISRAIHTRSRRANGPFVRVNCGAIPAGLIDSELFGHERGSFTGAHAERKGWFERADKGTLFLDEVGELPLDAQVRLLRVLQDGTLERVGSHRSLSVDVRIVAATHRNLQSMISTGQFREDLWYRIAVFPIQLAPLRDRIEDIPDLARHFALRASLRFGRPPMEPTDEDIERLIRYRWPGNVRELGAVIERAVILGEGRRLEVAQALGPLPDDFDEDPAHPNRPARPRTGEAGPIRQSDVFPTLDEAMRRHITAALERTGGRIEGAYGAANLLGINPHTLRGRMRKLQVEWRRYRPEPRHPLAHGVFGDEPDASESSLG